MNSFDERVKAILFVIEMNQRYWYYLAVFELEMFDRMLNRGCY